MEQELDVYVLPEEKPKNDSVFHEAYALSVCAVGEAVSVAIGNEYLLGASIAGSLAVAGLLSARMIRAKE